MSSSPLQTVPSKTDQVAALLRERILSGELTPGARLSMDALAREFGISKIPVREAIGRLEAHGLVTTRTHAGPTVATVDPHELAGAYLARQSLDPLITRLAAEHACPEDDDELDSIQQQMHRALERDDRNALAALNSQFHAALARMSGYAILGEISDALMMAVRRYRVVDPLTVDNWNTVVAEHDHIVTAIRGRDVGAAQQAATRHAMSQAGHDNALDGSP